MHDFYGRQAERCEELAAKCLDQATREHLIKMSLDYRQLEKRAAEAAQV